MKSCLQILNDTFFASIFCRNHIFRIQNGDTGSDNRLFPPDLWLYMKTRDGDCDGESHQDCSLPLVDQGSRACRGGRRVPKALKAPLQTRRSQFSVDQTKWGGVVILPSYSTSPFEFLPRAPRQQTEGAWNSNCSISSRSECRGHGSSFPEHPLGTRLCPRRFPPKHTAIPTKAQRN